MHMVLSEGDGLVGQGIVGKLETGAQFGLGGVLRVALVEFVAGLRFLLLGESPCPE